VNLNIYFMTSNPLKSMEEQVLFYFKNFRLFLPYMLLMWLPIVVTVIAALVVLYIQVEILLRGTLIGDLIVLILFLLSMIINYWTAIGLSLTIKKALDNNPDNKMKQNLSAGRRLFIPSLLTAILAGLIIFGGTILFIVPGVIFFIWYLFSFFIVVFENAKPLNALKQSKALVVNHWLGIFLRWIMPMLIYSILIVLLRWIVAQIYNLISPDLVWWVVGKRLIDTSIYFLIFPLILMVPIMLYNEIKSTPKKI